MLQGPVWILRFPRRVVLFYNLGDLGQCVQKGFLNFFDNFNLTIYLFFNCSHDLYNFDLL